MGCSRKESAKGAGLLQRGLWAYNRPPLLAGKVAAEKGVKQADETLRRVRAAS